MVKGIWHFSFTVKDIEKSKRFYSDLLGLEVIHEQVQNNEYTSKLVNYENAHLKVVMFGIPNVDHGVSGHVIELVEYVNPKGNDIELETKNTGVGHIAFVVDDIHQEFTRLVAAGVKFKAEEPISIVAGRNKGGYTIYFYDPDGITLELFQPPKRSGV